ncbi:S-layer homology domain-containing protein [Domibacillus indicus]|uniref:S-layer homology domain-containing protein n=1 Tax=Domibacillus indicus TaxID=1437523 RepID=UPI000617F65A|nr:S-layer homology domain-containing protein [Domibacillus indicus]
MKKPFAFLAGAALALGVAAPFAQAASFDDVPDTYGFYREIQYLSNQGSISGYADGTFHPDERVTRAAAAAIIGRALELDGTKTTTVFSDVGKSSFASGYIQSAVKAGVISGYSDGTFKPDETVTRGQLAIFLARAFKLTESAPVAFKDVSPSSAAYPFIGKILSARITSGYGDDTYRPDQAVTRAQFAAFMSRALHPSFATGKKLPAFDLDFLDVGQGDAILLSFPNGKNMLVDASRSDTEVKEALAGLEAASIDTFVATHPDADHIGGADYVIKNYHVKTVIDSGQDHTTQTYLDYLTAVQTEGAVFKEAQEGQNISPDPSVTVRVLHAGSDAADLNDGSIVLFVSYGEADYLLTGDAGEEVEAELAAKYDLDAEVLKVSHHGSDTGSSQAFIDEVSPAYGMLSYGEGNPYGHPSASVASRLQKAGAEMYATPDGTIETWSDGIFVYVKQGEDPVPAPAPAPAPAPKPAPAPAPAPAPSVPADNGKVALSSKNLQTEVIGIKNSGSTSVNMGGWKLVSVEGNQKYTFPAGFILGAGRTVYVTSGPNAKEQRPTYLKWTNANIWLNSGDAAKLYNSAGQHVSGLK